MGKSNEYRRESRVQSSIFNSEKKKKNILLYVQKTKQQNSLQMELVPWEGETDGKGASGIPPHPALSSVTRAAEWPVESQGHFPPWAFPELIHSPTRYPESSVITTGFTWRPSRGLEGTPMLGSHHQNILTGNNLECGLGCWIGYASLRTAGLELTQIWWGSADSGVLTAWEGVC